MKKILGAIAIVAMLLGGTGPGLAAQCDITKNQETIKEVQNAEPVLSRFQAHWVG